MKYVKLLTPAVFFAIFSVFCLPIAAQTTPTATPPPVEDDEIIKVDSRLVVVPVSVTDSSGQPVQGLTAKDFRVLEENKAQLVENVANAEKVPLDIALLFDISASTDAMFKFEQDTAAQFLRDVMRPDDRAVIFSIGEKPVIIQPRDSADKAAASVQLLRPENKYTAFYDSISSAADYLQRNTPNGRRKVVVVISDGEDTNSVRVAKAINDGYRKLGEQVNTLDRKTLYQFTVTKRNEANVSERSRVLKSLQNADTVFYSINPAGSSYQLNKMSLFGQQNMQMFADSTGGSAYLPQFSPIDSKDDLQNSANARKNQEVLTRIFRQLANELQAQYLVQYYSESQFANGRYIKLNVGLQTPQQQYKVRARQGYFVKN